MLTTNPLLNLLYVTMITILALSSSMAKAENKLLLETRDFQTLAQTMLDEKRALILAFVSDTCHFCQRLKQEQLIPLQRSEASDTTLNPIMIRLFDVDSSDIVIDFDGKTISPDDFIARYEGQLTPTVTFLNARGEQLSEKLIGYEANFYSAYFTQAIQEMKTKNASNETISSP